MTDGLLLIHAFPLDGGMWEGQMLGERTLAPHLPGFGGSQPAPLGVMTMSVAALRCLEAMDQAGLDRCVVCGLSMGGYVALELWHSARDRVAGLVLANTRSQADTPEAAEGRRKLAQRLQDEGNVLVASPPPLLSDRAPEALRERVRAWIAAQPPSAIAAAAIGMSERHDRTDELPSIDVPTLVITSELDTLIPPEVTSSMAEMIANARLEVIPEAGHLSNLEAPERFTELLAEHVAACGVEP